MTLRTLNYGNYGIFLIMGNAGFCPSKEGTLKGAAQVAQAWAPAPMEEPRVQPKLPEIGA